MRERRVREGARGRRRGGGRRVRRSQNAVHSVRNRVRVFRNGGVRRRRRHREFMALRYRVVYVGAIAVLLRFVVIRLNVNEWKEVVLAGDASEEVEGMSSEGEGVSAAELESGMLRRERASASKPTNSESGVVTRRGRRRGVTSLGVVSKLEPLMSSTGFVEGRGGEWKEKRERHRRRDERERMKALGQYRYTEGRKAVWLAGRVRRVSRRGAVVLTREEGGRKRTKRQRVNEQLSRSSGKAVRYRRE